MSKVKFKNAFIFEEKKSLTLMKNYITKALKISVITGLYGSGDMMKDSIAVVEKDYDKAIEEGKKFAMLSELKVVAWVNYYDQAVDLFALQIASAVKNPERSWKKVIDYLRKIQDSIGVVDIWHDSFNANPDAISINTLGADYERQIEALENFIQREGKGPFEKITMLSSTGKLLDKQFVKVKK